MLQMRKSNTNSLNSTTLINGKKTIGNILKVALSNILKIASGVLVGFILPKIIGVTDYGYYKIFTLYATYVGLFAFGINDGIYLAYGGLDYEQLDRSKFRLIARAFIVIELISSLAVSIFASFALTGEYRFIFLCLSVFLSVSNITSYYQTISQITGRFKELSFRTVIQSILTSLALLVLFLLGNLNSDYVGYRIFSILYITVMFVLAVWYIWTYRDITFGIIKKKESILSLIKEFAIKGMPLMIANLCSTLILSLDRQFVSLLFDTDTYAVYAFAYNMLALITTALSAISTVIYPVMKRSSPDDLERLFPLFVKVVLILVSFCLILYFPLELFIGWFLPQYSGSLPVFRVILPGLALSSVISIVFHNYYKALAKENLFFWQTILVLILSALLNWIAYSIFGTTISISIASILSLIIWFFVSSLPICIFYKHVLVRPVIYIILITLSFYLITNYFEWWSSMLMYIGLFLVITILMHVDLIMSFLNKRRSKS